MDRNVLGEAARNLFKLYAFIGAHYMLIIAVCFALDWLGVI